MINVPYIRAWMMHQRADPMPAVTTIRHAYDTIDCVTNRIYITVPPLTTEQVPTMPFKLVPIVIHAWLPKIQQFEIHQWTKPITPQPPTYLVTPSRPVIIYPAAIAQEAVHAIANRD